MWNTEKGMQSEKMIAFGDYYEESDGNRKLSRTMAMILGLVVTLEIMVAGAMILNIDFQGADGLALIFAFMVLYFGVVAVLTDK